MTKRLHKPRLFVRVTADDRYMLGLFWIDERRGFWWYCCHRDGWYKYGVPFEKRYERDLIKTHAEVEL